MKEEGGGEGGRNKTLEECDVCGVITEEKEKE